MAILSYKTFVEQKEALKPADINSVEFKRWFAGSKIVKSKTGNPKVVYHGSDNVFNEFKYGVVENGTDAYGSGFYFASREDVAKMYGANIMKVYLNIRNPLYSNTDGEITPEQIRKFILSAPDDTRRDGLENWDGNPTVALQRAMKEYSIKGENVLKRLFIISNDFYGNNAFEFNKSVFSILGYDGIIAEERYGNVYVAFFPEQIKSVYNKGTFKKSSKNIMEME